MLTDTDKALYASEVSGVPTDASSGKTLNGTSWLADLLKSGLAGYVAVQTVKAQNRNDNSVTTQAVPRVETAGPLGESGPSWKTFMIVGGVILAAVIAALFLRGRK